MKNFLKHWSTLVLAALLLTSFGIMFSISRQESPIMDELAHIPAGYSYLKYQDYRLNPEHPPLVKMIAAAPLLLMNLNFPITSSAWQSDANGQWSVGNLFLYHSDNNAGQVIDWARVGPILLTLLLILISYIWAKELVGEWWALIPAFLVGLSPTVLAHGHYVTTDIGAALGVIIALYAYSKYVSSPSRKTLILAGIAFGIAQLFKFSAVVLAPVLIILAFFFYLATPPAGRRLKALWRGLLGTAAILIIGFLLVYPFYFFTTLNYPIAKQQADTTFSLGSFAGGPTPPGKICKPVRCLGDIDVWMAGNPVTRPYAQYVLGILLAGQRSQGGNTNYFLGEVSASGSHAYFPVVYALKEPIPVLILIGITAIVALWKIIRALRKKHPTFADYLGTNFAEFAMFSFVVFYSVYSIMSPLNIGLRHLMPILPLSYILATVGLKKWIHGNFFKVQLKFWLIAILLLWFAAETVAAFPYYLSYFNEFVGRNNGWKYVTDSNYDWGQDLKRLADFEDKNNIPKIAVDYFGGGDVNYYLGDRAVTWKSSKGDPRESGIEWLAVSINALQDAKGHLSPGLERSPEDEYQWLPNPYAPYTKAGTSIFIYKLSDYPQG